MGLFSSHWRLLKASAFDGKAKILPVGFSQSVSRHPFTECLPKACRVLGHRVSPAGRAPCPVPHWALFTARLVLTPGCEGEVRKQVLGSHPAPERARSHPLGALPLPLGLAPLVHRARSHIPAKPGVYQQSRVFTSCVVSIPASGVSWRGRRGDKASTAPRLPVAGLLKLSCGPSPLPHLLSLLP